MREVSENVYNLLKLEKKEFIKKNFYERFSDK